ncbi:MAG TPA: carboxypeptidase-like regulatory domain-containing protein [Bryobacteraceae bacterium]|nr:carboxypeptidase-like regulatory domain-containing protein [Bryobacteraceae bacterium]
MRSAALLLLWVLAAPAQTGKPKELSRIEGRVVSSVTGEPVGKTAITLARVGSVPGSSSYATVSDSKGTFVIADIESGKYHMQAKRNGFLDIEYGAHASQTTGTVLDLETPEQLKDIELRLIPYGVLTGRIVDSDGDPVRGAQAQILKSHYVNGRKTLATVTSAYTNDLGEYRAVDLPPGRYYVYVQEFEGLPTLDNSKEQNVPVYYPNAMDSAGAVPIDVAAGSQVNTGVLMLVKVPVVRVKGKVVVELAGTEGLPRVTFSRELGHDTSTVWMSRIASATVSASGEFVAASLTPGIYTAAAGIGQGGIARVSPPVTVNVGQTNIDGVVLTIGEYFSVTGRIRVDGEAKLDLQKVRVKERRGGPGNASHDWDHRVVEDGTFTMDNLRPDRYGIVVTGLPDGYYTKSVHLRESDITYSGTELRNGSGPIDVVVSPKAGLVTGVVRADAGQPAPGATVVMIPQEKERSPIPECYQQGTADQYGRFAFKSVAPGEYKVYAWEDVEPTAWMDAEFMKPVLGKGEAVTVEESGRAEVQVSMIPAGSEQEKR